MLLKSLELQGFKTFPDKTKLNFDKGITAVVGPNGSGKSNISDAIRWVLGEQSVKALRCGKMEDVIFDGTDERKSRGYAKVSLTIDNKDRIIEIDEDEICITRRYYRSGESEYLINSKTVRLKDINELFMDTGLGKDGYSIIGQGKIDEIVSSKSTERRDIFEEAAGISKFRYRKIEAQRQLAKTDENLVRVNDIFSELETRVAPLREQSEKADKFLKYSEQKKELEVGIWLNDIKKYEKLLKEQEDKLFIVKQRESENNKAAEKIQNEIERISEEITLCSLKISKSRDELSKSESKLSEDKNYISVYKNDIFHNEDNITKLKQQKKEILKEDQDAKNKISELEEEKKRLIGHKADFSDSLSEYEHYLEKLNEEIISNRNKQADVSNQIELLNEGFSDKNINIVKLSSTLEGLEKKISDCDKALTENRNRLVDMDETCARYDEIRNTIKAKQDEISEQIKNAQSKADIIQKDISAKQSEYNELILSNKEKEKKAQMLEDLEKNFEGYSRSVKFVMNMAKTGKLFGISAPVSMLIDVDQKYKIAIETALGAMSQNIVCEDENSAKKAMYMLKEKNVGRATFLPISVIKKREYNSYELKGQDGFISMADKLCKTDDKYSNIISNLLARVGIVSDIDCAIKIAKSIGYKIKLVTLDGQVVNPGGSMTGGSANRTSGLLSRMKDISELQKSAKDVLCKAEVVEDRIKLLQVEVEENNEKIKKYWADFNVFNQDKVRIKTEEETITRERTKIQNEITELENIKERATKELKETQENKGNAIDERQMSLAKIEEYKRELSALKDSYEETVKLKDELREKINKEKIESLSVEKDISVLNDKLQEISFSLEKSNALVVSHNNEILDLSAKNNILKEKVVKFDAEVQNLNETIKKLCSDIEISNEQRDTAEKNSYKLRDKEKEVLKEHEEISRDLVRFEEKMSGIKQSYDSITAKLWDEYELTKNEVNQKDYDIEDMPLAKKKLATLKNKIKGLGNVNLSAIEEYKEVNERYLFMKNQISDIEKSKKELLRQIDRLTSDMQIRFKEKFYEINENFKTIFRELFSGGKASLELTDESDILNSGIEIKVKPPGKVVSHLELLSGGEKAMVSIVLYFAIMKVNPPPFCVLDEIEAALDDMNIERYVAYLKRINDKTQFIAITHRRGTMEEADVLYGVTMQEKGVSKLLQLEATQMAQKLNII